MSTPIRCRAADPASCADSRCPEKRFHAAAAMAAVHAGSFEAFAAAKEEAALTYASVKLPADFRKVVKALHPGVTLSLSGDGADGSFVTLGLIKLPEEARGLGLGTKIMGELIKAADANGWNLALSPAGDFGSSKVRLEVFYKRFGFRHNRGRSRDFTTSETMVRYA